ncbi:MAG: hypothetical protein KatS3mg014_2565 [Actinomycetota bacterium]|nr:MAG: hypothetical protein KatS3mg014_2565 [Actinomycetota bacterium]
MTLTAADFDYIRDLVRREAAIVLEPGKEYLALTRLDPIARSEGLGSVSDLVARLRAQGRSSLHDEVVDALTTNETSFFRDLHPFESLRTRGAPRARGAERMAPQPLDLVRGVLDGGRSRTAWRC